MTEPGCGHWTCSATSERRLDDPLIAVRAAHFAATALTAGVLAFLVLVAKPAVRAAPKGGGWPPFGRRRPRVSGSAPVATRLCGGGWGGVGGGGVRRGWGGLGWRWAR